MDSDIPAGDGKKITFLIVKRLLVSSMRRSGTSVKAGFRKLSLVREINFTVDCTDSFVANIAVGWSQMIRGGREYRCCRSENIREPQTGHSHIMKII